ncbi:hypothetical protein INT47_006035 [Mucor saturninus]|uniref:Cytidyltransferase-like domain-containing protein n=1 Tax=Mucor saturninus TaxID=64648 RepID=A0A8H7QJ58_9FUNG|nr:hypothetical protein INT47_006035 [Mucor saturninus]
MTSILLPLQFQELSGLEERQISFIEQSVTVALQKNAKLIIAVECQEIKSNSKCIDAIWERVQAFLGTIYVIQLNKSYQAEKPLFDCNVVFQDICAYPVHLESYITTVCLPEQDSDRVGQWNTIRTDSPLACHVLTDNHDTRHGKLIENTGPIEPLVFDRVAVGGTFDQLHAGHKILLTMTAILANESMVVGVTDDCMLLKKKHRDLIEPTAKRVELVKSYLNLVKRSITYEVVPITDPFGPTVTDPTIDALVVSKETLKGGDLVNSERDMRGYPPLELRIIDVISSENSSVQGKDMDVLKISSSWIREYIAKKRDL